VKKVIVKSLKLMVNSLGQKGSSLIEIVVATGVMALVLTAIVSGLTLSLKTNAESEYRSQAVKRAQEAIEVFRRERTLLGWDVFFGSLSNGGVYCLQTLPAPKSGFTLGACTEEQGIVIAGVDFYREVEVTIDESDPNNPLIQVSVTMRWNSGNGERDVTLLQVFRRWE